jgi:hypothetical protein
MINKVIFILAFTCFSYILYGQECYHNDLSIFYDIKTKIKRVETNPDSCIITVAVIDKKTKDTIQIIRLTSNSLFADCFINCKSVRSYTTKKNLDSLVVDNDYGDLIIADFNFDGKEDIAIKNNSGGNGGPTYDFYTQNTHNHFDIDKFLTQKVGFFPCEINKKDYTLITHVHANAYQYCSTTYKHNKITNKWKEQRSILIDADK